MCGNREKDGFKIRVVGVTIDVGSKEGGHGRDCVVLCVNVAVGKFVWA